MEEEKTNFEKTKKDTTIYKKIEEYKLLVCKNCLNTDCKNNISYIKKDKVTIIKCNDFISPFPNLYLKTQKNIKKIKKEIERDEQEFYKHLFFM